MVVKALQNIIYNGFVKNIGDIFEILEADVLKNCLELGLVSKNLEKKEENDANAEDGVPSEEDLTKDNKKGKK